MVASNLIKRGSRIESIVSIAQPMHKQVIGSFSEGTTYNFNGENYSLKDLPDYIRDGAGLVIELYLKLEEGRKNDNQR